MNEDLKSVWIELDDGRKFLLTQTEESDVLLQVENGPDEAEAVGGRRPTHKEQLQRIYEHHRVLMERRNALAHRAMEDDAAALRKQEDVEPPVARRLERIASALLSKAVYKRYVEPQIADIQHEYYEAMQAGRPGLAKWRLVRGCIVWLVPLLFALWKGVSTIWNWASK